MIYNIVFEVINSMQFVDDAVLFDRIMQTNLICGNIEPCLMTKSTNSVIIYLATCEKRSE